MTPLLLLPGMMCDARLFSPQIRAINDRAVMVSPIVGSNNIADLASIILQTAPKNFALAGLSMGGIVAMEVVRQAPLRVQGLCLMDTNPLAEEKEVKDRRQPQMRKVLVGKLAQVMRDEMKPNYLADSDNRQDLLDLCMEMAFNLGAEVFIRQSEALQSRPDQTNTLCQYKNPTLILHGESDILCPPERHQLMHSLMPNSKYKIIPNAGHLITLEQPDITTAYLQKWLKKVDCYHNNN